ncbi:MAG: accessory gene regulator B family protein [Clostridia bacterium]|nr:accessory gene regulator B family protein [Clostridia bacterium]
MLLTCSEYCVKWLTKNNPLSDDDKALYIYGFQLLFSTISSLTSILLISTCIKRLSYALCFLLFFFVLRLFCGGYHAKTFAKCFIVTNLSFLMIVGITELIIITNFKFIIPIINLFSTVVIWIFAPVKNENHPCSEKTNRKNKSVSRIISLTYSMVLFLLFLFTDVANIYINGSICFFLVALMILTEIFKCKGGKNIEYD